MVTPASETTGHIWGYEFASVGYGTLSIEILDESGKVASDHEHPAGSVGGGEYALGSGAFKLDMDADEDLRYAVIVCDETG
ncbi:MAG: hypothetical protein M3305_13175 [Actinomycetota bacterium]|nr:hypothetical protein [Actinomycetota bacterium]